MAFGNIAEGIKSDFAHQRGGKRDSASHYNILRTSEGCRAETLHNPSYIYSDLLNGKLRHVQTKKIDFSDLRLQKCCLQQRSARKSGSRVGFLELHWEKSRSAESWIKYCLQQRCAQKSESRVVFVGVILRAEQVCRAVKHHVTSRFRKPQPS